MDLDISFGNIVKEHRQSLNLTQAELARRVACGDTANGSVDIRKLTTLVFTHCEGSPPNAGERSIEKVYLYDSPDRGDFNYQFD